MKNELWGRGMVIGLLALVVCLLFGVALAINPGWAVVAAALPAQVKPIDYVNLVSAAGSFLAVVVAVWVALRQGSSKHREEVDKARLVAAGVSVRLSALSEKIRELMNSGDDDFDGTSEWYGRQLVALQLWLSGDYFKPTQEDLLALVPLPKHASFRIARAYDLLAQLEQEYRVGSKRATFFLNAGAQDRHRLLEAARDQLHAAADYLKPAVRECLAAARLNAKYPTLEELYPPKAS